MNTNQQTSAEFLKVSSQVISKDPHQDLSRIPNQDLLNKFNKLVKAERKITHLVLCYVLELDTRRLYLEEGYDSIHKYLTKHHGYSDDAAYARISAARLLKQNPEISEKLEAGLINLTQLVKVSQGIRQEKKLGKPVNSEVTNNILKQIENKSLFETEKVLAVELDITPKQYQKIKPQKDNSVRAEVIFTQEQFEIIKHAQSLISHVVIENDLAKAITHLVKIAIKKIEGTPSAKAIRQEPKKSEAKIEKTPQIKSRQTSTRGLRTTRFFSRAKSKREYIPLKIRRAVMLRAESCCEHVDEKTGRRCGSKFQIQLDHILPLALGGTNEFANLRALCGVHNRYLALKWGLGWWREQIKCTGD